MVDVYSLQEFADDIGKSKPWARNAVKLGLIKAIKVGGNYVIERSEGRRYKLAPFAISRREVETLYESLG